MMQKMENGVSRDMTRAEVIEWHESISAPQWVDLDSAHAAISARIDADAKAARDAITDAYSSGEMSSWPIKRSQALRFQASGNETDAPMLVEEAGYRRVSVSDLADLVLAKADVLASLEARIAGESGYLQDQLRAADSMAAVEAFARAQGWLADRPEMPELPPEEAPETPEEPSEPEPPIDGEESAG